VTLPAEQHERLGQLVRSTRADQALPPKVEDPEVYRAIASIWRAARSEAAAAAPTRRRSGTQPPERRSVLRTDVPEQDYPDHRTVDQRSEVC
jgi:hypothetical protein